jgi:hypothetical protein
MLITPFKSPFQYHPYDKVVLQHLGNEFNEVINVFISMYYFTRVVDVNVIDEESLIRPIEKGILKSFG